MNNKTGFDNLEEKEFNRLVALDDSLGDEIQEVLHEPNKYKKWSTFITRSTAYIALVTVLLTVIYDEVLQGSIGVYGIYLLLFGTVLLGIGLGKLGSVKKERKLGALEEEREAIEQKLETQIKKLPLNDYEVKIIKVQEIQDDGILAELLVIEEGGSVKTVKGAAKVVVEPELGEGNSLLEARYVEKTIKGKTRKEYLDRTIKVANYNEIARKIVY